MKDYINKERKRAHVRNKMDAHSRQNGRTFYLKLAHVFLMVKNGYNLAFFNRKLLVTTLTLLIAMAALAIIGFKRKPFIGYRTPAATGTPIKLYINAQNRFWRIVRTV